MKKFMNKAEDFIPEMLQGYYAAHRDYVKPAEGNLKCMTAVNKKEGKVALATGGGSGHLPLFLGYVGKGMLDGCAIGGVFQSPSAEEMLTVTKEINQGSGVLYIYGNYNGDIFNFTMAAEMADMEEDIEVRSIIAGEDVASGSRAAAGEKNNRRGVAGIFFVYKIAGAAADKMMNLDEVERLAKKVSEQVATMGVALTPCTVPRIGHPSFTIGDDEMEIGMGIHGEAGIRRGKLLPADEIADEIVPEIIKDLNLKSGDEVAILINGLGATPLEEQYLFNRKVTEIVEQADIHVYRTYVGEYATSLEMAGLSVSLLKLDEELKPLLDAEADTPLFKQFGV